MKIRKVVDERQERELLTIEHVVFWIVFGGLLISVVVQTMFMEVPFQQVLPELVIFMVCCVGVLVGCVKKGQWDFWTQPTVKTYAVTAAIGSMVFGLIFGVSLYVRDTGNWEGHIWLLILVTVVNIMFMFGVIFALSAIFGEMVNKKRRKLADAYEDEAEAQGQDNGEDEDREK